ncbi:esterase/lipase family protein [Amycolatopsis japonica]|uniref:esterase/lipase family protein n=1 Tax=Amycolatopsis japonica TaxID=208439 RepID=UPI0036711F8B
MQNDWLSAFAYSLAHPDALPQGINDFACRSDTRPVVLVNGTVENSYANWSRLAPQLAADGHCVYGFDYGGAAGSPIQQVGPMRASGLQLAAFIDRVRTATGSAKVDLIGHSQGGLLPLYYLNVLGGAGKVGRMIGIEPASQGVSLYGAFLLPKLIPGGTALEGIVCAACVDFTESSSFIREVAAGGYTRPGVEYTTIISRTDGVIRLSEARLPAAPNVTNIITQDVCGLDFTDHVNAVYDDITLRIARNALNPAKSVPPVCKPVWPLLPPQR